MSLVSATRPAPPTSVARAGGSPQPAAPAVRSDADTGVRAFESGRMNEPEAATRQALGVGPTQQDRAALLKTLTERGPQLSAGAVSIPRPVAANVSVDLGPGSERSSFTRTAELYSGSLTADLVSQLGPMVGSHTASRQFAVQGLAFEDKRGFLGGADAVEVELIAQHTRVQRSSVGGHFSEQQQRGVLDEANAVRVRLEPGDDGVYRAAAGDNRAFFVTSSETGYATQILEQIKVAVASRDGTEESAFDARYDLL